MSTSAPDLKLKKHNMRPYFFKNLSSGNAVNTYNSQYFFVEEYTNGTQYIPLALPTSENKLSLAIIANENSKRNKSLLFESYNYYSPLCEYVKSNQVQPSEISVEANNTMTNPVATRLSNRIAARKKAANAMQDTEDIDSILKELKYNVLPPTLTKIQKKPKITVTTVNEDEEDSVENDENNIEMNDANPSTPTQRKENSDNSETIDLTQTQQPNSPDNKKLHNKYNDKENKERWEQHKSKNDKIMQELFIPCHNTKLPRMIPSIDDGRTGSYSANSNEEDDEDNKQHNKEDEKYNEKKSNIITPLLVKINRPDSKSTSKFSNPRLLFALLKVLQIADPMTILVSQNPTNYEYIENVKDTPIHDDEIRKFIKNSKTYNIQRGTKKTVWQGRITFKTSIGFNKLLQNRQLTSWLHSENITIHLNHIKSDNIKTVGFLKNMWPRTEFSDMYAHRIGMELQAETIPAFQINTAIIRAGTVRSKVLTIETDAENLEILEEMFDSLPDDSIVRIVLWKEFLSQKEHRRLEVVQNQNDWYSEFRTLIIYGFSNTSEEIMMRMNDEGDDTYMHGSIDLYECNVPEFITYHYRTFDDNPLFEYCYPQFEGQYEVVVKNSNSYEAKLCIDQIIVDISRYMDENAFQEVCPDFFDIIECRDSQSKWEPMSEEEIKKSIPPSKNKKAKTDHTTKSYANAVSQQPESTTPKRSIEANNPSITELKNMVVELTKQFKQSESERHNNEVNRTNDNKMSEERFH